MVLWSVLAKKTVQKGHRRSRELHSHAETESTIPMSSSSTLPVAGIGCWYTIYDKNSLYCILCLRVLRLMGCACRMPSLCLETFEIHWYLNTDFYFFFKIWSVYWKNTSWKLFQNLRNTSKLNCQWLDTGFAQKESDKLLSRVEYLRRYLYTELAVVMQVLTITEMSSSGIFRCL